VSSLEPLLRDGELSTSGTVPAFDGESLVVELSEVHAEASPLLEVVCHGDGTAAAAGGTDGEVLVEGTGPLDGGLVDLLVLPDGVGSSVTLESALDGSLLGWVGSIFHDVVLDEWVGGPAVDGEETNTTGDRERAREGDRRAITGRPSTAHDKVLVSVVGNSKGVAVGRELHVGTAGYVVLGVIRVRRALENEV